jgi:hypothetical protein
MITAMCVGMSISLWVTVWIAMHNPAIHHEDTQLQNKQNKANSSNQTKLTAATKQKQTTGNHLTTQDKQQATKNVSISGMNSFCSSALPRLDFGSDQISPSWDWSFHPKRKDTRSSQEKHNSTVEALWH